VDLGTDSSLIAGIHQWRRITRTRRYSHVLYCRTGRTVLRRMSLLPLELSKCGKQVDPLERHWMANSATWVRRIRRALREAAQVRTVSRQRYVHGEPIHTNRGVHWMETECWKYHRYIILLSRIHLPAPVTLTIKLIT